MYNYILNEMLQIDNGDYPADKFTCTRIRLDINQEWLLKDLPMPIKQLETLFISAWLRYKVIKGGTMKEFLDYVDVAIKLIEGMFNYIIDKKIVYEVLSNLALDIEELLPVFADTDDIFQELQGVNLIHDIVTGELYYVLYISKGDSYGGH